MTETLTESFCERCGTRYEFSAPTRLNPLRKTRGFVGGLKNYLTSQDALSDAMGDAMRNEEGALASAQLEAFHESFNFCIDCRQYTCLNCWNDGSGRCRSCAPIPGTDDLAARMEASVAIGQAAPLTEPMLADDELQRRLGGLEAWPTSDLPEAPIATNGHAAMPWPVTEETPAPAEGLVVADDGFVYDSPRHPADELVAEPEPIAAELEPAPEPEPMVAETQPEPAWEPVTADFEPEPAIAELEPVIAELEPVIAEPEPEPVVAEVEPPHLHVVAWDDDTAYDLVPKPEPEPEPVMAEVAPEPEPEPVVAEVAPEPEPEPLRQLPPIRETILRFPDRAPAPRPNEQVAAEADSPELAARRAQLDDLGLGDPGEGTVDTGRPAVLPYRSRGAAIQHQELAARAAAQGATFWEASAREVASAVGSIGVQNCGQCGLSLSANARFCRRCGTRQAQSA